MLTISTVKNTLITLLVGLILFPFASFAQTADIQYQSALLQLITLLTQQVQTLEAQLTSQIGGLGSSSLGTESVGGAASGSVTVEMDSDSAYTAMSGPFYNIAMTINNGTGNTIYVPAAMNYVSELNSTSNVPGFTYTLASKAGQIVAGTGTGVVSCSPQVDLPVQGTLGYIQACEIKAGESAELTFTPNPDPYVSGEYPISLMGLSYTTTTTNPAFTILTIPSNETGGLVHF